MKKLFLFAFAFAAMTMSACSDDDNDGLDFCPQNHIQTVSFEASENMTDVNTGEDVVLGSVEMNLFDVGGNYTYNDVFCAKAYVADAPYDGPLFSTADGNIWFGSYYASSYDGWGGFALTRNFTRKGEALSSHQFSVWADRGACNTATCAVCYVDSWTGGAAIPAIEFDEPRTVCHLYLANSVYTYSYLPTQVDDAEFYYRVVISGSLNGVSTGSVTCTLIDGTSKVSDWKRVDLSALGRVDRISFNVESNEANTYGLLVPSYFAVDEIGFIADK